MVSVIVLYGVNILTLHLTSKYILCRVWFIPASINSVFKSVSIVPSATIFIFIFGPNPEKNLLPVKLPQFYIKSIFITFL